MPCIVTAGNVNPYGTIAEILSIRTDDKTCYAERENNDDRTPANDYIQPCNRRTATKEKQRANKNILEIVGKMENCETVERLNATSGGRIDVFKIFFGWRTDSNSFGDGYFVEMTGESVVTRDQII